MSNNNNHNLKIEAHLSSINETLRLIMHKLDKQLIEINKGIKHMSKEFDDLTAQVTRNSEVLDSAIVLINGIADRITAAGVDPVKLNALTTELKAKDDALAAAVVANTPVTTV